MIRGTTAQFKFKLPYGKDNIDMAEVKFWQPGNSSGLEQSYPLPITKIYKKEVSDGKYPWNWIGDSTLLLRLGQRETLTFSDRYKAYVQIRIRTVDGLVTASPQQIINVHPANWSTPLGEDLIEPSQEPWIILDGDTISEVGEA